MRRTGVKAESPLPLALPMLKMVPFLILLLVFSFSGSWATDDSEFNAFKKCVQHTTGETSDRISKILYAKDSSSYSTVLRAYIRNARFNTSSTPKPSIIITPSSEYHVRAAVICSKRLGLQMKIRSGGHDYEGISYVSSVPFVILDMFNLRNVTVDLKEKTAWVQSGATLGEVYHKIWENSGVLGFPAGVCATVGVGGHLSGAGYGNMVRKYGLSVDHVIDAIIVNVEGRILNGYAMGGDLFWAIKGGGGASFGVIIAFKIALVSVPEIVTVFRVEKYLEDGATEMVQKWQEVAPATDDSLFMRMLLQPVTSKVNNSEMSLRATVVAMFLGDSNQLLSLLNKDFPVLGLKKENCLEMSWIDSVLWWDGLNGTNRDILLDRDLDTAKFGKRKSDYVQTPIPKEGLESLWKKMIELGNIGLVFNPYGGIMNKINSTATPFPHRAGNLFKIQYSTTWTDPSVDADKNHMANIRSLHEFMTPFVSHDPRSAYLNYRDLDIGINSHDKNSYQEGKIYGEKYFNANFQRLVKVKTEVDPENFFWNEQSIPILSSTA